MGALVFPPSLLSISAGLTWASGPGLSLANANGVSFGIVGNTITASIGAAPAAGIGALSAGTQIGTTGTIAFGNANGVSFGMAASSLITASVGTTPITAFSQWAGFATNYQVSQALVSYQKVSLAMPISASSGALLLNLSGHSNSSGGVSISIGAYSLSGATAALASSVIASFTWTSGGATNATSVYGGASGTRYRSFAWALSMTPGDYVFAVAVSTTNDGTVRIFGRQGVNIVGSFAGLETAYFLDGVSLSTTNALPSSVFASDTNYARTGLSAVQQPGFILIGTF